MSSAPGVLNTTCVPLNSDHCRAGKTPGHGAWPSGSQAALAIRSQELGRTSPPGPTVAVTSLSPEGPVGTRAVLSGICTAVCSSRSQRRQPVSLPLVHPHLDRSGTLGKGPGDSEQ